MHTCTRRTFLSLAGTLAGSLALPRPTWAMAQPEPTEAVGRKPNILFIVADDLGYADLGCQGMTDIETPHIDSLATRGVRFTQAYVTCPVCGPSRAGFLTGRYQNRFGYEFNVGYDCEDGLPLSQRTMGDHFKAQGYTTGIIGKWHQGERDRFSPTQRGFDEFFGFRSGSHYYLPDPPVDNVYWQAPIYRNDTIVEERTYLTDAFARESVDFINRHHNEPWFLHVSFSAVHVPLEATEKYRARYQGKIENPKRFLLAAMLSAMDDAVGAMLAALRQKGIERDTLVVFLSDNGGVPKKNASRNDPLRGRKGQLLEGGIRLPMLMCHPGRLPAGKVYDAPVISLDVLPTALAAAGATPPAEAELDGVNLLPHLTGQTNEQPHEALYWRYGPSWAIRKGNYKLFHRWTDSPTCLYDLDQDIRETTDLAEAEGMADVVNELQTLYDQWNQKNTEPAWPRPTYPLWPKEIVL